MEPLSKKLTLKEMERNKNGLPCQYSYSKVNLGQYKALTNYFEPFENHSFLVENLEFKIVNKQPNNVDSEKVMLGFPSFKYISHVPSFENRTQVGFSFNFNIRLPILFMKIYLSSDSIITHLLEKWEKFNLIFTDKIRKIHQN